AAWCLTCKFNEASVLEAQDVREAFQRHAIVKLKADWTNGDPAITKLLQQFGQPGVPLYVLYPAKNEEPIVFPEVLTKSMLLDKLETVARRVASQQFMLRAFTIHPRSSASLDVEISQVASIVLLDEL